MLQGGGEIMYLSWFLLYKSKKPQFSFMGLGPVHDHSVTWLPKRFWWVSFCGWFRNPKQPPGDVCETLQLVGYCLPTSTGETAGFQTSTVKHYRDLIRKPGVGHLTEVTTTIPPDRHLQRVGHPLILWILEQRTKRRLRCCLVTRWPSQGIMVAWLPPWNKPAYVWWG